MKHAHPVSLPFHKLPGVFVTQRVLGVAYTLQVPRVFTGAVLRTIVPVAEVLFTLVIPEHLAIAVANVVAPIAFVGVATVESKKGFILASDLNSEKSFNLKFNSG